MIIIADTSPLNYLILIDQIDLLRRLFGEVIIPVAVLEELRDAGASPKVLYWAENLPGWVEPRHTTIAAPPLLDRLDPGEREAILLSQELASDLLIVDDKPARQIAIVLGISITGTIGILDKASRLGLIDIEEALTALKNTNFRVSDEIISALTRDGD